MTGSGQPAEDWVELGSFDHLEDEDVEGVRVAKQSYAVYRCNGALYVTDDRCTHQGARLSKGIVVGDVIECPLHQGRFHIPSGRVAGGPVCEDIRTYRTMIYNGLLYVAGSCPVKQD